MSKKVSKTTVGTFMIGALVLIIAAVLLLGSGKFFKDNHKVVMFFQGSVKGLSIGSPVNFRGVKIGKVTDIKMLMNRKDLSVLIAVYAEWERGSAEEIDATGEARAYKRSRSDEEFLRALIDRGARAQLEMQSFVTGQLLIAVDFYPDKPAKLVRADPKTPEVPTIPTPLQELVKRAEKIPIEEMFTKMNDALAGIEKMINSEEIRGIVTKLDSTIGGVNRIVNSPETAEMFRSVSMGMDDTRVLIRNIDGRVGPVADEVKTLIVSIDRLSSRLEGQLQPLIASLTKVSDGALLSMKKVDEISDESPIITDRLVKTLNELTSTARSLRLLTDTIQSQPESLIFGKKNIKGR